jgi:hypothetical protein
VIARAVSLLERQSVCHECACVCGALAGVREERRRSRHLQPFSFRAHGGSPHGLDVARACAARCTLRAACTSASFSRRSFSRLRESSSTLYLDGPAPFRRASPVSTHRVHAVPTSPTHRIVQRAESGRPAGGP